MTTDYERIDRVPCPACGNAYEQRIVKLDGKDLIANKKCETCIDRKTETDKRTRDLWNEQQERDRRRDEEAKRTAASIERLGTPPLYANASLATFELHGTAEDRARQDRMRGFGFRFLGDWPQPSHETLILRGAPGTGKGHWAWSIARAVAGQGFGVKVVKLSNLIRELRRSWRDQTAESEEATLTRYRMLDLLVIDELSRHAFYGEQIHQHLYDVIDDRIENKRPTILTSNEDDETLREILRPALWSRINGHGGVLEFGTADYRKRPRAA